MKTHFLLFVQRSFNENSAEGLTKSQLIFTLKIILLHYKLSIFLPSKKFDVIFPVYITIEGHPFVRDIKNPFDDIRESYYVLSKYFMSLFLSF